MAPKRKRNNSWEDQENATKGPEHVGMQEDKGSKELTKQKERGGKREEGTGEEMRTFCRGIQVGGSPPWLWRMGRDDKGRAGGERRGGGVLCARLVFRRRRI